MAHGLIAASATLRPHALLLGVAVLADLVIGDPVYRWHPVRIMGRALTWIEEQLRRAGFDGYGGGILLFVALTVSCLGTLLLIVGAAYAVAPRAAYVIQGFFIYSLLALGDLLHHVRRVEAGVRIGDLDRARAAVRALVGRDTDRMDGAACRRAAVESLSENLTDGFVSAVFWYALGGLPGLVVFKVVSTLDSMVGYKTPRYLRFGWCGARLDDAMNYLPARFTWLLMSALALVLPSYSGRKAWRVGLEQHAALHGPNSGWGEAATAGALQRRIVGPIWRDGVLVTDIWIGDAHDPPLATANDVTRAEIISVTSGLVATVLACLLLL